MRQGSWMAWRRFGTTVRWSLCGGRALARAVVTIVILVLQAATMLGDEPREAVLPDLGLLARLFEEALAPRMHDERKSGIPGFEVRSDEVVFGQAKPGTPWLLELRERAGAIELTAANDSRSDFSLKVVALECDGMSVSLATMPQLLRSNALEATRIARLGLSAVTPGACMGEISSDTGATSQIRIEFAPLTNRLESGRRPE